MAEAKKPVATLKTAEAKAEVKAAPKAEVKAEVKETKKAVEKKAAAPKKAVEKKPVEKKAAAPKKEAAKKPAAEKKAAAPKAAAVTMHVQFSGKTYTTEDLVKIAKDVWKYDLGRKEADFKTVELYVKPEESTAYYVINGDVAGSFLI